MAMNHVGTNKRMPLIVLLVIFVAGSTFIAYSLTSIFMPARNVFLEKDFYQTDIVFSEDIECLDSLSEAEMLIDLELDESSGIEMHDEIKPVTFKQGKAYQLKAFMQVSAVNENMSFEERFQIRCDDGKWISVGFSEGAGESKEYHNKYLDGTFVTVIGFEKIESHEKVLSELKNAEEEFLSPYIKSERLRGFRYVVLPVCISLVCSLAISALALFIHKRMTAAGKNGTVLIIIFVIIDILIAGLLLLFLFSFLNPYFLLL